MIEMAQLWRTRNSNKFTKFMEQKPIKKRHRKYDADFKKEVLKMIESGHMG